MTQSDSGSRTEAREPEPDKIDGAMPKPTKRAPVKSSPSKTAKKAKPAEPPAAPTRADEAAYIEMLVKTGQAVPAGRGKMPSGVTHELVPDGHGHVKAVRRRFSIS